MSSQIGFHRIRKVCDCFLSVAIVGDMFFKADASSNHQRILDSVVEVGKSESPTPFANVVPVIIQDLTANKATQWC